LRFKERRFSIADQQKRRFQTAAPWGGEAAIVLASSDGALDPPGVTSARGVAHLRQT
jgi:hypothetical protein